MADDFLAGALTGVVVADAGNAGRLQEMQQQQRAQTIGDMFGAKPPTLDQFRETTGQKTNYGKMIVAAAVGAAALAGGAALIGFASVAAPVAVIGAIIAGGFSASHDRMKATNSYDSYITEFAHVARESHDAKVRHQTIEAVHAAGQPGKWAATIDQQRSQPGIRLP